jgi:hypothetical protein
MSHRACNLLDSGPQLTRRRRELAPWQFHSRRMRRLHRNRCHIDGRIAFLLSATQCMKRAYQLAPPMSGAATQKMSPWRGFGQGECRAKRIVGS